MRFVYNDGGRAAAGYRGEAGDCSTRAIAIALELPYQEVYDALTGLARTLHPRKGKKDSARSGVPMTVLKQYLASRGWRWVSTMGIGTGCRVHLADGELPMGRVIARVSKHLTAVLDGVIHDTHDPQRTTVWYEPNAHPEQPHRVTHRCVYGYWVRA